MAEHIVLAWWIADSLLIIPAAILAIPAVGRRLVAKLFAVVATRDIRTGRLSR